MVCSVEGLRLDAGLLRENSVYQNEKNTSNAKDYSVYVDPVQPLSPYVIHPFEEL